jgi:hypothetical protein
MGYSTFHISFNFNGAKDVMDATFDAGGKASSGTIATTIVAQWTWAATLLQSTSVTAKVTQLNHSEINK